MSNTAQLSARERILSLLDDNSFVEIGALVTKRSTDFNLQQKEIPADGVITGYGVIDGNLVYVYSQDSSSLNGTIGEMHAKKITHIYDLALKVGAPVIGLVDCAGLRLQEATDALNAFGEIYLKQSLASGVLPQITGIFGHSGGGVSVSASLSDFTFMTKQANLFVSSPNALDGNYTAKLDTSKAEFQANAGVVDFVGEDDASVLAQIRTLITILPSNNEDDASYEECTDDLNRVVPSLGIDLKDTAVALREISDDRFFVEVKADYAKEMVTGFIRLNGMTVGAVANRTEILDSNFKATEKFDSLLTSAGCYKAARFVSICDAFNIPVLTFTNITGFKATVEEEKSIAIASAKLTYTFANATVPKVNVIVGKAYGSPYVTMNSKHIGADLVFAWEGTEIGMMDSKAAAEIIYGDEIKNSKEALAVINEKAALYQELQSSPEAAAKRGYVDSIISPDTTRKHLIYAYEMLFTKRDSRPSKKHGTI
ncbi:acetyl-CoA carboxylase carboxyltransferase component [Mobilisporobacter senegalensis]|uniref:Acetyl-CoA carboxylase carboxyltransferase component n=1 Tax=Mobilisporobacter senegalensis TaxID=1329262 RepID=A0A3N1XRX4_9FIRM|nr:carboxyl transferase domain-containing protein [Mobilisporobacter senegalensis]ROR29409.1 acetyl-CoA carboxylase carboxyltransferase component [Mobilisporobacter senegalensis]